MENKITLKMVLDVNRHWHVGCGGLFYFRKWSTKDKCTIKCGSCDMVYDISKLKEVGNVY